MKTSETRRAYAAERYQWLKAHGICVSCGSENARPNRVLCDVCAEKAKAGVMARYRSDAEYRAKARQNAKANRAKKIAEGRCSNCGRPASDGKKMCMECLNHIRNYRARRNPARIPVELRNSYGLCRWCCEPLSPQGPLPPQGPLSLQGPLSPPNGRAVSEHLCPACFARCSEAAKRINANPTEAMLRAREAYAQQCAEIRGRIWTGIKQKKQTEADSLANFERMVQKG